MDLILAFSIFMGALIFVLINQYSLIFALAVGFLAFFIVGLYRGFSAHFLVRMSLRGMAGTIHATVIMMMIGVITGAWRISGTTSVFVAYGAKLITPSLFLLIAFLLSAFLSYALGTAFGTAGTLGVVFMALARSGGVDPLLTAGALISGCYFGDRCSPTSSSAHLVATITKTDIMSNVKMMLRTAMLPTILCIVSYAVLSYANPIHSLDQSLLTAFQEEFQLSVWAFLPALFMLLLPVLHVNVERSILASILCAVAVAYFVQDHTFPEILQACIWGYEASHASLSAILNGGGLLSMETVILVMLVSSALVGIFDGTNMLRYVKKNLAAWSEKIGRYPVTTIIGMLSASIFCNQAVSAIMSQELQKDTYPQDQQGNEELAMDIENSSIIMSALVPWCTSCCVPLAFFDVGYGAMFFAMELWLIPLCYLLTKKYFFNRKKKLVAVR